MPILSQPAFGPKTALAYITCGTLLDVWTLVWYFTRETAMTQSDWFWLSGLFLTGMTFVVLGFALGPIGRAARQAEMPPAEIVQAEATIQNTAAANPPAVVSPVGGIAPPGTGSPQVGGVPSVPMAPAAPVPAASTAAARVG